MRTTLDIDDAVLSAAKELARQQNVPTGQVVSQLLRKVLAGSIGRVVVAREQAEGQQTVAGFRPFKNGRATVSNDVVERLREIEGV